MSAEQASALIVPAYPGQPAAAELERLAAAGRRPRKDYVEVARALEAEVLDFAYLQERASPAARALARRAGPTYGQIWDAFEKRRRFRHVCAWADRIGLPLALLFKLTRSRRDLALVSGWLSRSKKAVFLKRFKVHSHLGAIINYASVQMGIATTELGVPEHKLHLAKQPVDELFWRPRAAPAEGSICSVGWEARDYPTLVRAVSGLDLDVQLAIGVAGLSSSPAEHAPSRASRVEPSTRVRAERLPQFDVMKRTFSYELYERWMQRVAREGLPANVGISQQLAAEQLRELYARARFVVIPLLDVDSDCGVTAITEAMAMGKAIVLSRTRGQVDIVRDGEHGIYVPPGNPRALREAIDHLSRNPSEAERMGRAGRALVEREHRLDDYVRRVAAIVRAGS